MIRVERLCKSYGGKAVLRSFTHRFPERGIVLIQGPSGSGKTTLLRLISGLEHPDSGLVWVAEGTRLSMVFQEDRLLPTLDVRGNLLVALGGKTAANIASADRCLARCGLAGEERRFPQQLSGGMRRRVAIARAVAYGGDILLLDEPFKGLDPSLKRQVTDFVFENRARLTLLVSHDEEDTVWADEIVKIRPIL